VKGTIMSSIPADTADLAADGWRALPAARSELIKHLHTHPDHAGRYPAGHDFMLVSTADIRREHQRQHLPI
jgi:hypothetical protein